MKKLLSLLLTVAISSALCGTAAFAQSLQVTRQVPAYISTAGLSENDMQFLIHETVVQCPALGGSVEVRAGLVPGDTSFLTKVFPLSAQTWPDSTWVAPASDGGWRIGIGRHLGINAMYVELRSAGQTIGTGSWAE
ncbi:MAG: hypothetical protein K9J06_09580 [Flavobacteriales bacterium]|nr:hypothetical protein [Flavobacteriales bacterium]